MSAPVFALDALNFLLSPFSDSTTSSFDLVSQLKMDFRCAVTALIVNVSTTDRWPTNSTRDDINEVLTTSERQYRILQRFSSQQNKLRTSIIFQLTKRNIIIRLLKPHWMPTNVNFLRSILSSIVIILCYIYKHIIYIYKFFLYIHIKAVFIFLSFSTTYVSIKRCEIRSLSSSERKLSSTGYPWKSVK